MSSGDKHWDVKMSEYNRRDVPNTFPTIVCATTAVLEAAAKQAGLSIEDYRLGTLKRCDVEIANLLDDETLDRDWRDIFLHLLRQVRVAVGDGGSLSD